MKNHKLKLNSGFTLIEVLVTVAVTGILTVMATVIFINTVRNSKKAEVTSEGRQNAALVIDRMQKDARSATSIDVTSGDQMIISAVNGDSIIWYCVAPTATANGYISREINGIDMTATNRDTVEGVSVSTCAFSSSVPGNAELVTVDFLINEGVDIQTGPQEFGVSLPFKTSITKRGF